MSSFIRPSGFTSPPVNATLVVAMVISVMALMMTTAGCSTSKSTSAKTASATEEGETSTGFPPAFVQEVNAFVVHSPDGDVLDLPLLGGLNVPRPQFIDIDADGDDDLFLQENTGSFMFFEHVRTDGASRFVWDPDRFAGIEIGEWSRLHDMDDDGDFDILAEQPFSYVRYYRNDGTPEEPAFTLLADSLINAEGEPLFSDRQNIPNLTDIDCDGLIDLFIGRVEGVLMRYELVEPVRDGPPVFQLVNNRFEDIEIIGQIGGSLHGANTIAFADFDQDGDQDLFWGDFFEPSLLLIENTGTCASPNLRSDPIPFPVQAPISTSGYNAPAFSDLNGDGDLDMFVGVLGGAFNPNLTSANNFYYFERSETDQYELVTTRFLETIDIGRESIPAFADLDLDGDFDLVLSNKIEQDDFDRGNAYYFENTGTPMAPSFQQGEVFDFEPAYHYAPVFADLDADGDLDALVGTWNQGIALYRNTGTVRAPRFVAENTSYIKLTRGSNTMPALVDIDADSDLDLFVGEASGTVNYYRNDGSEVNPDFVLVSDEYLDIDVGRRSAPTFADLDEDGDYDMIIGKEMPGIVYYRNDGTPQAPSFVLDESFDLPLPALSNPVFVDIDADGDLDVFSGGDGGGVVFFRN